MIEARYQLSELSNERPYFRCSLGGHSILALVDTGARIPVWVASERLLTDGLGLEPIEKDVSFSGFGGKTFGNLYEIPIFQLGSFVYPRLKVVACGSVDIPCSIILSATMFRDLCLTIDFIEKLIIVKSAIDDNQPCRNIIVESKDGAIQVLYNGAFSEEELLLKVNEELKNVNTSVEVKKWYRNYLDTKKDFN